MKSVHRQAVRIHVGDVLLEGDLSVPEKAQSIVLFAHGSGSSRHNPRHKFVARTICETGTATLLFDLLTHEEEQLDMKTRGLRFDIPLLAKRLINMTNRITTSHVTRHMRVGYFGAGTGGGAALVAAAELGEEIGALVSRSGRPDLAGDALLRVSTPTLFIVGGLDKAALELNHKASQSLRCRKEGRVIPGATHLFEEPGALENVAKLAAEWFVRYLQPVPLQPISDYGLLSQYRSPEVEQQAARL